MPKTAKQKEQNRLYMKANYHSRKENAKWQKAYREKTRDICFAAYGGYTCVCCNETEKKFLTLDHKNNDGAKHRKEIGYRGGYAFYLWIIRNNFPPMFQVLCFNCNHGRQLNGGVCPHKEITMGHSFEQSRPEHMVIEKHIPEGHAHLDQKLDKGMRSPMVSQLPMEAGLSQPEDAPGINGAGHGSSEYGGM